MPRRRAPRRLAALASAVAAMIAAAAPAAAAAGRRDVAPPWGVAGGHLPAAAAHRAQAQVSIVITSVSPQYAKPGSTVTVSGEATNPTGSAVSGLSVALWSSSAPLRTRDAMAAYLDSSIAGLDFPEGTPGAVFSLAPHASKRWSLKLRTTQAGMHAFGVYPLAAQLSGPAGQMARARSFLPYWPGKRETRSLKPLSIAWVWPVIDAPQQTACRALQDGELAGSVAPGGRLSGLLAAGSSPQGVRAKLTWAIDPALIDDTVLMTHPYRVGETATCTGGTPKPPDRAARAWLAGLRSAAARQDFFTTPYADVDEAALAHHGLDGDLASAFRSGRAVAKSAAFSTGNGASPVKVLGQVQHTRPGLPGQMAWPPGGMADYSVLEDLAHNNVRTVILDSSVMPPQNPALPYTPSAVATTPALANRLHVLLADHTIARILAAPQAQVPGAMPEPSSALGRTAQAQAASFGKEQWFLAETAIIAAEAPGTARSVVITPPRRWDPAPGLASTLLKETVRSPWLHPATLASLAAARHPTGTVSRKQPPEFRVSHGELRAPLLSQVRKLSAHIRLLASILTTAGPSYLDTAVAAIESSAWRGGKASQRRAAQELRRLSAYVQSQLRQVTIVHSLHVTLGGKSGPVAVSVNNKLGRQIQVRLQVGVPTTGRMVIGHYLGGPGQKVIKVPPRTQRLIKIPVQSAAAGSTTLTLRLATPDGKLLPLPPVSLTVEATHFGTLAIVIIVGALLVFVLTAAGRAIRRAAEPAEPGEPGEPGEPTGEDGEAQPGERSDPTLPDRDRTHPDRAANEKGESGRTGHDGPDPASGGAEPDSVVNAEGRGGNTAGTGDPRRGKEADDHASTQGRAHRL